VEEIVMTGTAVNAASGAGPAAGRAGTLPGCTEIELLISPADAEVPVFPGARLHAEAALAHALAQ
jgi:aspartate racemase